jgi:hypothetical protein
VCLLVNFENLLFRYGLICLLGIQTNVYHVYQCLFLLVDGNLKLTLIASLQALCLNSVFSSVHINLFIFIAEYIHNLYYFSPCIIGATNQGVTLTVTVTVTITGTQEMYKEF